MERKPPHKEKKLSTGATFSCEPSIWYEFREFTTNLKRSDEDKIGMGTSVFIRQFMIDFNKFSKKEESNPIFLNEYMDYVVEEAIKEKTTKKK